MSKSSEIKNFCSDSKILCNTFSCEGDTVKFYLLSLYINDMYKPANTRLTPSESVLMAHIIDYTVKKGPIDTKEAYEDVIITLVKNKVSKNKFAFTTTKTNLRNKNYLMRSTARSQVLIDKKFLNILTLGHINNYLSLH